MICVDRSAHVTAMASMGDRLRQARQRKYDSAQKAAEALGVRASTYRAHENGQNEFSPDEAKFYARKFGVTAAWLLTADRGSSASTFDPDSLPEDAPDDRTDESTPTPPKGGDVGNLIIFGGMGLGSIEESLGDPGEHIGDRPAIYADHINGYWSFPPAVKAGWRNMPNVYSIPVQGDSMEPTLTSGSYVFVDMTHTVPSPEDIYACDFGDGLAIKRLQLIPRTDKIKVMSDNPRYSDHELLRQDVRVYGRVVAWFQWRG
jgi:phage repressor protein C with HTH and peptisase S24 domain